MTEQKMSGAITDVPGIQVGHAQNHEALTGCTVILCGEGAVGGVDQRGGAGGTRQTDALKPLHVAPQIHALLLAGGSAYGLEASTGVMRYLEENGVGFQFGPLRIPIVPTAILFDLGIGRSDIRPDAAMGYEACRNASSEPPATGNVGAGCGATVGKILGLSQAMKSGIGSASMQLEDGVVVGAIAAVNAFGDVIDPVSGRIVAGARKRQANHQAPFADSVEVMKSIVGKSLAEHMSQQNTVIGVVATNARLDKVQNTKVAQMAHDGLARAVRPAHTMGDGDTIFSLSTEDHEVDVSVVGAIAAEVFAQAILNAVLSAEAVAGLPTAQDFS